jgi:predicted AAA+ superfamily ATPase
MVPRRLIFALTSALAEAPAVALPGPRQVGRTILALELVNTQPAVYLHLERSGN